MHDFIPGQRWICDAELQLGLGTVLSADHRSVTVVFLATGDTRIYSKQTAPLTRVAFKPGDSVQSHDGWRLTVESVRESQGLLTYAGTREDGSAAVLEEGQLDNFIQLNRPADRLFTGQIDASRWFELRYETALHTNRLARSELRGLTGGRTSLISHQLYIAHEVANRYAPRVLLADEVGLGKTIEAGMIIHQQLLTERAHRVLVVVPETLQHQWLVEMMRRFNLHFSIFDEERCKAIEGDAEEGEADNPFQAEQLVICTLDFLLENPKRVQQVRAGEWDLLVVDEAHHLQWTPEEASVDYLLVERLAAHTKGVLLLTATPEQLGRAGHFARLRLLDPDRFHDYDTFVEEESGYQPVAEAIEQLLGGESLNDSVMQMLAETVVEGDNQGLLDQLRSDDADEVETARIALVEHLLDRHGTGRVLYRNTRAAVKGFPGREVHAYSLALPGAYAECLAAFQGQVVSEPQLLLSPELIYQAMGDDKQEQWTRIDPRIEWLAGHLKGLKGEKVLVIAASAGSALDIADALRIKTGIHAAVFHEHMSIVERDRAAAYFADMEHGSPVLVCSEIGSEGRNFQFAHHLVLFDLPFNPDLLEQRIGRLDRIGQSETIKIHVPYMEAGAQAAMFQWYHQGLNAFQQTCPAGHAVFTQVEATLRDVLADPDEGFEAIADLIAVTAKLHGELNEALHQGRDRLLEYNSCRPRVAERLRRLAEAQDRGEGLKAYLDQVFDCFGLDSEDHSEGSYIIRPGERMQISSFPGMYSEVMTITFDRATALANEDMQFVTWEHPLTTGAMDMVLSGERGNTAVTAIRHPTIKPGTMLLEAVYLLESASSDRFNTSRYLPPTAIRVIVDQAGRPMESMLSIDEIRNMRSRIDNKTAAKIVRAYGDAIRAMIGAAELEANRQAPEILSEAREQTQSLLEREINRLKALSQVNPNVRSDEVEFFEHQWRVLEEVLESVNPRLDAIRVLVAI